MSTTLEANEWQIPNSNAVQVRNNEGGLVVSIDYAGNVEHGKDVTPNAAAVVFWNAVAAAVLNSRPTQQRITDARAAIDAAIDLIMDTPGGVQEWADNLTTARTTFNDMAVELARLDAAELRHAASIMEAANRELAKVSAELQAMTKERDAALARCVEVERELESFRAGYGERVRTLEQRAADSMQCEANAIQEADGQRQLLAVAEEKIADLRDQLEAADELIAEEPERQSHVLEHVELAQQLEATQRSLRAANAASQAVSREAKRLMADLRKKTEAAVAQRKADNENAKNLIKSANDEAAELRQAGARLLAVIDGSPGAAETADAMNAMRRLVES